MKDKILEEAKRVLEARVRQPPRRPHRLPHARQARAARRSSISKSRRSPSGIKSKDIKLVLDDKAKDFLIEKGYDPHYGARPMRRAVERYLEDPMAEEILRGTIKPGDTAKVSADERDSPSRHPRPRSLPSPHRRHSTQKPIPPMRAGEHSPGKKARPPFLFVVADTRRRAPWSAGVLAGHSQSAQRHFACVCSLMARMPRKQV